MKPNGGGEPTGSIADAIKSSFESFSGFKEKFSSNTALIQGSGWGWLVYNSSTNKVEYKSMPNQTSPRTEGLIPLLGCDVWEHAYYLKYQNKRPDYIAAWWNVINWEDVSQRFDKTEQIEVFSSIILLYYIKCHVKLYENMTLFYLSMT